MELDKRIKEGKKPLTCFDTEQAKEFLGKECYFSNAYCTFEDLHRIPKSELQYISNDKDASDPYKTACYFYPFCLPCEWVKEEKSELKYRPYSLNEFLNEHEIGDKITYRHKTKEQPENFIRHKEMICGYQIMEGEANTPGEGLINLGGVWISLQAMFDDCETPNSYLYPEVWQPFGVIEE